MDHSPLAEAKRTLGLDPDVSHLVVLGGSRINDFMDELVSMIYVGDDTDSEIDPAQKELLETLVKKGCAASGHGDTSLAELCIALLSDEPRRVRMASCWEERKQT